MGALQRLRWDRGRVRDLRTAKKHMENIRMIAAAGDPGPERPAAAVQRGHMVSLPGARGV